MGWKVQTSPARSHSSSRTQQGIHCLHCLPEISSLKSLVNLMTSFAENGPVRGAMTWVSMLCPSQHRWNRGTSQVWTLQHRQTEPRGGDCF